MGDADDDFLPLRKSSISLPEPVSIATPTPAPVSAASEDLVTLVITTSPTPSAPSTELLEQITNAFRKHCPALTKCCVIMVIDTYDHVSNTARLKKGHVTAEGAAGFAKYKANAKKFILWEYAPPGTVYDEDQFTTSTELAEFGSVGYGHQDNSVTLSVTKTPDGRITFIEPWQRLGFGLAVRSALRLTKTPYVWIQQHDWALISDIPLTSLLHIMQKNPKPDDLETQSIRPPINYVCFPSIRMIRYATSDHVMQYSALRALTQLYKQTFSVTYGGETAQIPLTPMFFWHDKPHIAATEHYLNVVFPNRIVVPRGAFIEDTVGHRARTEMKDGEWKKWACWLYYPDDGKQLCLRHLKGRTWRGAEGESAQVLEYMRLNEEGIENKN
ncbi:hypothetical protein QBC38DRAFT_491856 [Podospora fimiseda]|uniref:Uncharacterized protein n=1 Tax=Podospora fimiseda TaxID=252190 RepID=A0AAN6YLL7_9PEZI|nr:hypothetical protein QBC38DRAFT_491856 [Podospora fimiseda]